MSRSRSASNYLRHRSSTIAKGESCRPVRFRYIVSTGEPARRISPIHTSLIPKGARSWFPFLRNGRIVEPCDRHPYFHSPSLARYEPAVGLQPGSASRYASAGRIDLLDSASRRYEIRGHIFLYRIDLSACEQISRKSPPVAVKCQIFIALLKAATPVGVVAAALVGLYSGSKR